ncbi:hypothetical protein D6827_02740 [Candidatus Parcubacteria bacterium]|nr:MAG: hypothetical protein D6827_02740 [Candidatus Parcubacteria bacterium]
MIDSQHKTLLPFILIGLVVFAMFVGIAWYQEHDQLSNTEVLSVSAPQIDDYQSDIKVILQDYKETGDAKTAYSALLLERVPAEYKELHLRLVLLFARADSLDIFSEIDKLSAQYNWLKM